MNSYDVVFNDTFAAAVMAKEFRISRTDVTFYDEDDSIKFWAPINVIQYVRKRKEQFD